MDYRMFRKKILTWMRREAGGSLKATVGNRVTTRLSLYPHSLFVLFCFVSPRVLFSLASYAQKHSHSFMKTNLRIIKAYQNT